MGGGWLTPRVGVGDRNRIVWEQTVMIISTPAYAEGRCIEAMGFARRVASCDDDGRLQRSVDLAVP